MSIVNVSSFNLKTRQSACDLQSFTVTADAVAGSGAGAASFSVTPLIIVSGSYLTCDAGPVDGAAIVVKTGTGGTSHKQNMAWHKNAITLAMAPLDLPQDGASASRESFGGISIRAVRQYNITSDETVYRFDILYGVKAQNPDFAGRKTSSLSLCRSEV